VGIQTTLGTTTCFGPIYWPSSVCTVTYRTTIQHMWGILGLLGGVGKRDLVITVVILDTAVA
jgi:hypothetical protein